MDRLKENVIEWIEGEETATVTLTARRYITKIEKLATEYPDKAQIVVRNKDGSIMAHIPVKWIVKPGKPAYQDMTEEQRAKFAERMRNNFSSSPR